MGRRLNGKQWRLGRSFTAEGGRIYSDPEGEIFLGRRKVSSSTGTMEAAAALQSEQARQTIASNGLVAPVDQIQGTPSPSSQVDGRDSKDRETSGYSIPDLPEEIWLHIHSLMPMDDAARAACLSHAFLSSWRCYPKLTLSWSMLCSKSRVGNLSGKIDSILRNHSGIGLKILTLHLHDDGDIYLRYIDSWLQVAVTPGIEELTLILYKKYKFPCSILSHGVRNSIRSLHLGFCVFRPTPELGPSRSLTKLSLQHVCITEDGLECLLSNSLALEHLDLCECIEITFLKIPSVLLQLSYLNVSGCWNLQVIENKAPSLSRFILCEGFSKLSLGEASQTMKELSLSCENAIHYACAKLLVTMPNLETLHLCSFARWILQCLPPNLSTSSTLLFSLVERSLHPMIIFHWHPFWTRVLPWRLGG